MHGETVQIIVVQFQRDKEFFSSHKRPNRLWGPKSLLFSWYLEVSPSSSEMKPSYVCTFLYVLMACSVIYYWIGPRSMCNHFYHRYF